MFSASVQTYLKHILLTIISILTLGPILVLVINTFKPADEFMISPFGFPAKLTFANIVDSWNEGHYARAYLNSLIVGLSSIVIVCISAGLGGYALAKMKFRGSNLVMVYLLLVMTLPLGLFLVPLFYIWQHLHLMDTTIGLIIIYSAVFTPFNLFLLRSFFLGIPNEVSESAALDGCSDLQILMKIIVPISSPVFLTVALLVGLWSWNEFFFANAFTQTDELRTVATKYLFFTGAFSSDWSKISAAGFISIFPIVVLYLFLQRRFIEGITEGSLKG